MVENDAHGRPYYKQAFNTQACEQLNAWLGGFEQILKRMTAGNFDWFLHTMLAYNTSQVMKRQVELNVDDNDSDEEEGEE